MSTIVPQKLYFRTGLVICFIRPTYETYNGLKNEKKLQYGKCYAVLVLHGGYPAKIMENKLFTEFHYITNMINMGTDHKKMVELPGTLTERLTISY